MSEIERLCEKVFNGARPISIIDPPTIVRAVLKAMREPDEETLRRGWANKANFSSGAFAMERAIWLGMIDHLLSET